MMTKTLVGAVALLISSTAMAQTGPVPKVTADQLVCQLSGDCAKIDTALDTQDKPDSRGFSLARRTTAAPVSKPTMTSAYPATHHLAIISTHSAPGAAHHLLAAAAPAPVGQVGHADLSITFVSGSAELTQSGKDLAQTFMVALRSPQLSGKRFMIGGHTDAIGSREANQELSQRRAQALVDFLVAQGASASQFEPKGFGYDQPLAGTNPKAPSNRRVEVVKIDRVSGPKA